MNLPKLKDFLFLSIIGCLALFLHAVKIEVIKDPKPTCAERRYIPLKLAKSVSFNINDNVFMVGPFSLTTDNAGNIYVLDRNQSKIFKFSPDLKFLLSFGRVGQGPGEFGGDTMIEKAIHWGRDGCLHITDSEQNKIITFNEKGNFLKETRINRLNCSLIPTSDELGNFYLPSTHNGAVDVYDKNGQLKVTFLNENLYYRHLFIEPTAAFSQNEIFPSNFNTKVLLPSNTAILVYLGNDANCCYLEKNKLARSFHLWPEKALRIYQSRLLDLKKNNRRQKWILPFFCQVFMDGDDPTLFYAVLGVAPDQVSIYQFDFWGVLKNVYSVARKNFRTINFYANKNGGFLAIGEDAIEFYKEGK